MTKWACLIGLTVLAPAAASAQSVSVRFDGGYVTVSAQNAPVRQILSEWARQGQTKVVNAEKIQGGVVTLELTRVPEKQALEVLLRSAAGYMAAPRSAGTAGLSSYDRILIMATTSPAPSGPMGPGGAMGPRAMPTPPPTFVPPGAPPVMIEDQDDAPPVMLGGPGAIVSEPGDEGDDQIQPPFPGPQQGGVMGPDGQPVPGDPNEQPAPTPVVPGPTPLPQGVITQPAPGLIPVPQQQPKP
jgi:hypothetical protein